MKEIYVAMLHNRLPYSLRQRKGCAVLFLIGLLWSSHVTAYPEPWERGSKTLTFLAHEHFDAGTSLDNWNLERGPWSTNQWDRLETSVAPVGPHIITLKEPIETSFETEFFMRFFEGTGSAGIQFRKQNSADTPWSGTGGYLVYLTGTGTVALYKKVGANPPVTWAEETGINPVGRFTRMRVVVSGSHISVFVDGAKYIERDDWDYQTGYLSLYSYERRVFFDDLTVTRGADRVWFSPSPYDLRHEGGVVKNFGLRPDYLDNVLDEQNWPDIFGKSDVWKSQINILPLQVFGTTPLPDADLDALIAFINSRGLKVAFEVAAFGAYEGNCGPGSGAFYAEFESDLLQRWVDHGGEINYLTSDHAINANWGRMQDPAYPCQMTRDEVVHEAIEALAVFQNRFPGVRVGIIESLGFFDVTAEDGSVYPRTTPLLIPAWDFDDFMAQVVAEAHAASVALDHFHIDFGPHGVRFDGDGADLWDFGRVIAVERIVQSYGVNSGVLINPGADANLLGCTASAAVDDATKYTTGYVAAGGNADHLVGATWHVCPSTTGPESDPTTIMGLIRSVLDVLF